VWREGNTILTGYAYRDSSLMKMSGWATRSSTPPLRSGSGPAEVANAALRRSTAGWSSRVDIPDRDDTIWSTYMSKE
jgi:hypothetical protein